METGSKTEEQNDFEALAHANEQMQEEIKMLRRKELLSKAHPPRSTEGPKVFNGVNLSNVHVGFIATILAILATGWNFIGAPVTSMRDDIRDIKNNYVKKDDLRDLAKKSEVDTLATQVANHSQSITRFDSLKEQRDRDVKDIQDTNRVQNTQIDELTQRLTRIESRWDNKR